MQFTYTYLKNADENNVKVGNYEGKAVYAITKDRLDDTSERYYYIIYDDNNYLYHNGYVYAMVTSGGNVNTFSRRRYNVRREEFKPIPTTTPQAQELPQTTTSSTTGDVELELIVEGTLKKAREMTIDSLLEGFDYGL